MSRQLNEGEAYIINYHTSGVTAPLADNLELGELAVGCAPTSPAIYIKDSSNNIHTFLTKSGFESEFQDTIIKANGAVQPSELATINGLPLYEGGDIELDMSVYEVVTELPKQDIKVGKIYLVIESVSETENILREYIYHNDAWEFIGVIKEKINLSDYLTIVDAEKTYLKKTSTGATISQSSNGSLNNFSNGGQAYLAVRDVSERSDYKNPTTGSLYPLDGAAFGVKLDGTAAFSHKKYDTFDKTTGAYTGAVNTAVLMFSGNSGLLYAKNTSGGSDVKSTDYKYVGVIDSPDEKQKVYSAKQVDELLKSINDKIGVIEDFLKNF